MIYFVVVIGELGKPNGMKIGGRMGAAGNRADFIYKIATGSRKVRTLMTPVGALVFASVISLVILLSLWLDRLLGLPNFLPGSWRPYLGVPILALGLVLLIWSVVTFALNRGTPVPFNPPPALVADGPYAYARNPMLTGLFIALFGAGLLLNSIVLAFIFTPLFVLLNVYEIKHIEEPELERRLGTPYLEYKRRVPRFCPRARSTRQGDSL